MAVTIQPLWVQEADVNFGRGVVAGDLVIFGDMSGDLKAVRVRDGFLQWKVRIGTGVRENLALQDGVVYGSSLIDHLEGGRSVAFKAEAGTGEVLWEVALAHWPEDAPAVLGDELLYCTNSIDSNISSLQRLRRPDGAHIASAHLANDWIKIAGIRDGELIYGVPDEGDLYALPVATNQRRLLHRAGRPFKAVALKDDLAYLGFSGAVSCIDLATGTPRWTQLIDRECGRLTVQDDMLIAGCHVLNPRGSPRPADSAQIIRFEAATGRERWIFSRGNKLPGTVAFDEDSHVLGSFTHRPGETAVFVILDAATGAEVANSEQPARAEWILPGSPVTVVSHGDFVYGFAAGRLWQRSLGSPVRAVGANPMSILACTLSGELRAVARSSGLGDWSVSLSAPLSGRPATAQGLVMVGDARGLVALAAIDGAQRWRFTTEKAVASPPVPVDDQVVFGCRDEMIRAVRIADGTLRWEFKTNGFVDGAAASGADGHVYVGSGDGMLYCLDRNGAQRWAYPANEILRGRPLVTANAVIIGDGGGFLHSVDLETGEPSWRRSVGTSHGAGAVQVAGGLLWIAEDAPLPSGGGRLYQLAEADGAVLRTVDLGSRVRGELDLTPHRLLVATDAGEFLALDKQTGETRRIERLGARSLSGALFARDGIAAGDETGFLHFLTP